MSDLNLLTFGVVVTFIALCGGYVMLREGFVRGIEESSAPGASAPSKSVPVPVHREEPASRSAAG